MPDSGAVRAGRAFVEIFAKDVNLQKGLRAIQTKMKAWGATLTSIGTRAIGAGLAVAGPIGIAAHVFAEMGDELAKASTRTGISVEALSRLKYAADQSGTSMEGLENGLKKMSKAILEAGQGSAEAMQSLAELGLTAADLAKLKPDEQFVTIAEAISRIPNPTQRAAVAMKVFGKSGTALLPLMADGAKGINALIKQCDDLGLTMSTEDAKAAEEFGDRMSDLWRVAKNVAFTIGGAVAPVIRSVALALTQATKAVKQFVQDHKGLVIGIATGAALLIIAGSAIYALGTAFTIVSGIIGTAVAAVSGFVSVIGTLGAAIASPMGILVAAVSLGIMALFKFTDTGSAVAKFMSDTFGDMEDDALSAFGGIRDALKAGDWALAAQIAGDLIYIAWTKAVGALKGLWNGVKFYANSVWLDIGDALLKATWSTTEGFLKVWAAAMHTWRSLVNTTADLIQDTFLATAKSESAANLKRIDDAEKAGKITHAQADAMRDNERKFATGYDSKMREDRDKRNDADFDRRMDEIRKEYDAKREMLAKLRQAEDQGAADANIAEAKKLQDEVTALEASLRQKMADHTAKAAREAKIAAPDLPTTPSQFSEAMDFSTAKVATAGTFNPSALFGLSGNNSIRRIEEYTRRTAIATEKLKGSGVNSPMTVTAGN